VRGNTGQIVPKWLDLIEQGKPPTIVGDGTSSVDFVHVTDVARANVLACASDVAGECFNVGSGIETTVNDLVGVMARAFGHDIAPVYQRSDGRPPQRRWCRIDKARRLLGFEPTIGLEQGLRDLIAWRRTSAVNA
jgi:UDP-glucose 4-epimerase